MALRLPRFQYSLGALVLVLTVAAVLCSLRRAGFPWLILVSEESQLVLAGILLYVAWKGDSPGWATLLAITITAAIAIYFLGRASFSETTFWQGVVFLLRTWSFKLPTLLLLPLSWFLIRVLYYRPGGFDGGQIQRAAILSMIITTGMFLYALAVVLVNSVSNSVVGLLGMGVYRRAVLFYYLAVATNLAVAVPWIKLDRARIAKQANRPYSSVDKAAKWLLLAGLSGAALAMTVGLYFWAYQEYYHPLDRMAVMYHFFLIPNLLCSALCLAAVAIQLYRDRWHRRLTGASCLYFISFWLLTLWQPRLLLFFSL